MRVISLSALIKAIENDSSLSIASKKVDLIKQAKEADMSVVVFVAGGFVYVPLDFTIKVKTFDGPIIIRL